MQATRGWRQPLAAAVVLVLGAATLYEAAVALEAIPMGDEPGEDAVGASAVRLASLVSLLAGLVASVASIRTPDAITRRVRLALPLAGASVVVATGYAFDPYFAPSLRRYTDSHIPPTWLLVLVVGAAVLAALISSFDPRTGMAATALVLLVSLFTLLFTGTGH